MGIIRAVILIYCGISFALGCIYLNLASKNVRRVLHLLFASISLCIPVYAVLTLLEYDAATLAQYDTYIRVQMWFTAALMALFLWQGGNFFRRNRPGRYRPDALPAALMPKV